jgi:hypothetical protein
MIAISGYFGPTSRGLNLRRLFCLWLAIVFYQAIETWFICWMDWVKYSRQHLIRIIFPLLHNEYWFFTAYFGVMLASPALNLAARGLSKLSYGAVIFALFVIELNGRRVGHFLGVGSGYEVVHLGIVYFISGYFRVHGNPFHWRVLAWGWLAFAVFTLDYARFNSIAWLFPGPWQTFTKAFTIVPSHHAGVLQLQLSTALVLFWTTIPVRGFLGVAASFAGGHAFAVYIIHDSTLIRPHIFRNLFRVLEWKSPPEIAAMNRIRCALTILLFGICVDSYRAAVFDRIGTMETTGREMIASGWRWLCEGAKQQDIKPGASNRRN